MLCFCAHRYDDTAADTIDIVYVSRMKTTPTAVQLGTFNADTFPCLALGVDQHKQQREDTVCCLDRFNGLYTTLSSFDTYIRDENTPVRSEIQRQASCRLIDAPPSNTSAALLREAPDFVVGTFSGMPRSYSSFDPTPTRGYKDINVFLALEDIEMFSAVSSPLSDGKRLRFFVGMAHIRTTNSKRIVATTSQVDVVTVVTEAFVMTTPITSTESAGGGSGGEGGVLRSIGVSLTEVHHQASNVTTKFATITIIVAPFVTAGDVYSVIPPSSLVVGMGYSKISSQQLSVPCIDLYVGAGKTAIDELLEEQSWCVAQADICAAQGPTAVGPGGRIQFPLPLPDSVWDYASIKRQNFFLASFLFLDFMLVVYDKKGSKVMTNLNTQTEITTASVLRRCTENQISSSIEDVMEIDMFLGLAGNESSFANSVVQSLDVTRRPVPGNALMPVLERDISSAASNVMTMLVKGDAALFENEFAKEYTLAVEDMISLHFLNDEKRMLVEELMAKGLAFAT